MNEYVERATQPEPPATSGTLTLRALIALGVIGAGLALVVYLVSTRPQPTKKPIESAGTLVEVIEVQPTRQLVKVPASGQIIPARQVAVAAEVGGRITWLAPEVVPGGRFDRGDLVARIDSRDYALALEQQRAQVDSAQTALEIERSQKEIAEREWKLLGEGRPESALALRDPQMKTARAALEAARSGLERAQLSVGKTALRAPFNAMVQRKTVDIGQLVGPATPVVTLVGTDAFWVQVAIPVDRLRWIQIPGVGGATEGSAAVVTHRLGNDTITRDGKVIRLLGDLDPVGRMARVLVEITDPLGLKTQPGPADGPADDEDVPASSGLPLLLGSYVEVAIDGREVDDVVELSRQALRSGDSVYVMTDRATLDIRQVDVLWRKRDTVLVARGLEPGDKIVITPLAAAIQGMELRTPDMARTAADSRGSDADARTGNGTATTPSPSSSDAKARAEAKAKTKAGAGASHPDGAAAVAKPSR